MFSVPAPQFPTSSILRQHATTSEKFSQPHVYPYCFKPPKHNSAPSPTPSSSSPTIPVNPPTFIARHLLSQSLCSRACSPSVTLPINGLPSSQLGNGEVLLVPPVGCYPPQSAIAFAAPFIVSGSMLLLSTTRSIPVQAVISRP